MPKRKRKTTSSSQKRKPNSKSFQPKRAGERSTSDKRSAGNDEEARVLNEFAAFDALRGDAAPLRDAEGCKLKASRMRKGQQSKYLWS